MDDRRAFLKASLAALAAHALPAGAARPEILPLGAAFLVNGWILTRRDLEALGFHDL